MLAGVSLAGACPVSAGCGVAVGRCNVTGGKDLSAAADAGSFNCGVLFGLIIGKRSPRELLASDPGSGLAWFGGFRGGRWPVGGRERCGGGEHEVSAFW